jgi:hypothetical protein
MARAAISARNSDFLGIVSSTFDYFFLNRRSPHCCWAGRR